MINKTIFEKQLSSIEENLSSSGILKPGKHLIDFMQTNRLAEEGETVYSAFFRACSYLAKAGEKYYGKEEVKKVQDIFLEFVCSFEIILGSPILTNAGRREGKSISACSIPAITLSKMHRDEIAKVIGGFHSRGMGTGFCLDDLEDPCEMIKHLNAIAISEVQQGKIERSVGNMGVLSIDHPKVLEFIRIKTDNPEIEEWKFNLSVNMTEEFMQAWKEGVPSARSLMEEIAKGAHASGDPGLIFMDRINKLNKVPQMGSYKTVVPCGEVSLFKGEVCQFAYLNLSRFVKEGAIKKERLKEAVHTLCLLLDNAVEANTKNMPNQESAQIISNLRRIGIGVCGFAEVLQELGLPYDSSEAKSLAENLMSLISYESKQASVLLAKKRGSFPVFSQAGTKKELFIAPFKAHPTDFVPKKRWEELEAQFETYGIRNLSTTILPPSGRSSLIAGVTPSIEPPFKLNADSTSKKVFKCALELPYQAHLEMTAAFQKFTDEGISKTVNLPNHATVEDVIKTYQLAHELQLKGITIYRDGCRHFQPKALHHHSALIDPLFGPVKVSSRILNLLKSPLLTRLKGVHQNGTNYLVDPRQSTSRYEHSVGTLILTQKLGGDESKQIAALLHDISHTAFSHIVDLVFKNEEQNTHDLARTSFFQTDIAKKMIEEFEITEEELSCTRIPMVKGKEINVDRLDYCIRDLHAVNRIYHPQYSSIMNNVIVNEKGEIVCKNKETARLIFTKFLEVNQYVYFDPKAEVAGIVMSAILEKMLKNGDLCENDLFETDAVLIDKIKKSPFKKTFEAIGPTLTFSQSEHPTPYFSLRKLRFLNPSIVGFKGKLTDHCESSKKQLEEYFTTPTKVFYNIPILEELHG